MSDLLSHILATNPEFRPARLSSLYSDFSHQRTTNPDGYAANIQAWDKALFSALRDGKIPSVDTAASDDQTDLLVLHTGRALIESLTSDRWGRPLALGAVIDDALSHKRIIPLPYYLASQTSIYSRSWAELPWQALRWSLRSIGILGDAAHDRNYDSIAAGRFVVVANLEGASKRVMARMEGRTSLTDRIFGREAFDAEFGSALECGRRMSDQDLDVLLVYMARDARQIACDGKTIKFKPPTAKHPDPISEHDTTIASLKALLSNLDKQISALQLQISTQSARVQSFLSPPSPSISTAVPTTTRPSALSALRLKSLAEKTLLQRESAREQVQRVFWDIQQASNQAEAVAVMAASVDLLKALNRRAGDVEAVEEVVEGFVVEAERAEELRRVLVGDGAGAAGVGGLDWRELEEELAAMGREKGEEERVVEDERREREVESALAGLQRVSLEEIRPAETASESVVDAVAKRQQEVPKQISVLSQRELQETAWTT